MKQAIVEFIVKNFLSLFGSTTAEQWEKAKELVKEAATKLAHLPGAERRQYVVDGMKKLWSKVEPFLLNLLVDSAFGVLKDKLK